MTEHGDGPLRVGVNLTWLVPGVVGGSEEYLVRSLLAVPPTAAVEVTVFGLDALAVAHPDLARRFELSTLPLRGRLKSARVAAETSWLAVEAHRRRLDVVHHGGGRAAAVGAGRHRRDDPRPATARAARRLRPRQAALARPASCPAPPTTPT